MTRDTRYPYTYACDLLREAAGLELSRSGASKIRQLIADVLCLDDEQVAQKLAERYLEIAKLKDPFNEA